MLSTLEPITFSQVPLVGMNLFNYNDILLYILFFLNLWNSRVCLFIHFMSSLKYRSVLHYYYKPIISFILFLFYFCRYMLLQSFCFELLTSKQNTKWKVREIHSKPKTSLNNVTHETICVHVSLNAISSFSLVLITALVDHWPHFLCDHLKNINKQQWLAFCTPKPFIPIPLHYFFFIVYSAVGELMVECRVQFSSKTTCLICFTSSKAKL